MATVTIGKSSVGERNPAYIVGEVGINHNGNLEFAKRLIDLAASTGCNAVKFQKRTIDVVYSAAELAKPRDNPFGSTNGDLKRGLEFGLEEYREIDRYCRERSIDWFVSCWDEASVDFIDQFEVPCYKIASASLTDDALLKHTRSKGKPIILATGMSTMEQVYHAVEVLGRNDLVILHSCSTYPANYNELNLRVIPVLAKQFGVPVGYSGHETGVPSSVAAAAIGACVIERHITLDRSMWGSDQAASLGPSGLEQLVRDIRLVEMSMGDGVKRLLPSEVPVMEKLRRVDSRDKYY